MGMASLVDIEGISPAHVEKLKAQGLHTTEDLLKAGATPKSRGDLAAATGISEQQVLRWVNMADLFRIKGVAEQYSDLLEASGVDTVPELAQRNPVNLLAKMVHVNEEKKLVHRVPTEEQVTAWVAEAQTLPRMISYGGTQSQKAEDLAGSSAESGGGDSWVPQAETAAAPVWAAEQVQKAEGLAGSSAASVGGDIWAPPAETAAAPTWAAGQAQKAEGLAHEWWGRRLWSAWRRNG
jgi:hypothetical protein